MYVEHRRRTVRRDPTPDEILAKGLLGVDQPQTARRQQPKVTPSELASIRVEWFDPARAICGRIPRFGDVDPLPDHLSVAQLQDCHDEIELPHDLGARLPQGVPVHVFHGLHDETAPPSHADLYARAIPQAQLHRLPGRDHQLDNDLSEVAKTISPDDP